MNEQHHIIHRLNVDVDVAGLPAARRLYQNMSGFIQQYVLPALELEMDAFTKDDIFIQAGGLTLDIELAGEDDMETSLPRAVAAALRRVMRERVEAALVQTLAAPATPAKTPGLQAAAAQNTAGQSPAQPVAPATPGSETQQPGPAVQTATPANGLQQPGAANQTGTAASAQTATPAAAQQQALAGNTGQPGAGLQQPQTPPPGTQNPLNTAVQDEEAGASATSPATANPAGEQPADADLFEQRSLAEKTKAVFIYFVQTGRLPWYAGTHTAYLDEAHLLQAVFSDAAWVNGPFKTIVARSPLLFIKRWVLQFSPPFLLQVIETHSGLQANNFWQRWQQITATLAPAQKNTMQQAALAMLLQSAFTAYTPPQQPLVYIQALLQQAVQSGTISAAEMAAVNATENINTGANVVPAAPAGTTVTAPAQEAAAAPAVENALQKNPFLQPPVDAEKKRYRPVEEEDGLYVVNGGLVLLHPFLEYFFKECKLITGKQFAGETEQQTALHLLYYLATGKEQPFECDLLFERYLCGLPAAEPVHRFIPLPAAMKAEADNLLQAAIQHWKVLKNTSVDGLRQGFLQRQAKLVTTGMQHRLIVAPETIDILLQQLPWGYAVIQLPWMQQLLHVEWNNG